MSDTVNVIKVGGAVVEDEASLRSLVEQFAAMPGPKALVHGGGRSATALAAQLGIETRMVAGRRVTDADTLRIVTMVYGGLVNKRIVAMLQAAGVNALGLTGADMNVIRSRRRAPKQVKDAATGAVQTVDYGYVGDIDSADGDRLAQLMQAGVTPVLAPLSHDGQGNMLNVNADTIAATTAKALAAHYDVTLTYCFEKAGVMLDPDNDASAIEKLNRKDFERLASDGTIQGGMIPKIENAFDAIDHGVRRVVITSANHIDGKGGTEITEQ